MAQAAAQSLLLICLTYQLYLIQSTTASLSGCPFRSPFGSSPALHQGLQGLVPLLFDIYKTSLEPITHAQFIHLNIDIKIGTLSLASGKAV